MLVLLDERGREYTSMQFAAYLEKLQVCGRKRIVFLIGGHTVFPTRYMSAPTLKSHYRK